MHSQSWRAVVVDGETLLCDLLRKILQSDWHFSVVYSASDAEEGFLLCRKVKPHVAMVDFQLPDGGGPALAKKLTLELPETRILAVSLETTPKTIQNMNESGVHGFVEKTQPLEVLRNALEAVAGGGVYFTPTVMEARRKMSSDPYAFQKILSDREQEVLHLIAQGMTSRQVAEKLGLSPRTVEKHRQSVCRKTGMLDLASMIAYAKRNGI